MADIQQDPQAQDQRTAVWGSISEGFENIAAQTALIPAISREARTLLGQFRKRVAALEKRGGEFEERLLELEKGHVDHEKRLSTLRGQQSGHLRTAQALQHEIARQ